MGKTRRKQRPKQGEHNKHPAVPRYDGPAKAGPGAVLSVEQFFESGTAASKKRLRNHGEHPLTLAFHRGQLISKYSYDVPEAQRITANERLAAGEEYRRHYEQMRRSGRDSTDMAGGHGGGGAGTPWTETQAMAIHWVKSIERRMHHKDAAIIRNFCGEGYTMPESLRSARIDFHLNGVTYRIREALDELVAATTGRRGIQSAQDVA